MEMIQGLITGLGLPVAMLVCVGWYFVKVEERNTKRYDAMVSDIKQDSKEREEKLYTVIANNQRLNEELALAVNVKLDNIMDTVRGDK